MPFSGRDEGDERGILVVAGPEMVGDKVTDGGPGTLQLRFGRQMDDEHVELVLIRRRVRAEAFVAFDVVFEGIFDVSGVPRLHLGPVMCRN